MLKTDLVGVVVTVKKKDGEYKGVIRAVYLELDKYVEPGSAISQPSV